jgi:hypothetical protein
VLKIPNATLRFRLPEASTNQTFAARLLAKIGLGKETKPAATNTVPVAKSGDTNKTEVAANTGAPLTGNEPPQELFRRVQEMRERGEEVPPEIRAKLRELFQSGALQRPGGGGGGYGARGGGGSGSRSSQPAARTIYLLATNAPSGESAPQAVRVKTGISDGAYTEITDGLKEGDVVIMGLKFQQSQVAAAPAGASPFGGGGGGGGIRGGGR